VYRILCLFRPTNGFHHFVVGVDKLNIEFDPIMPYSLTARAPETIVDSLRLFDITQ
jgi:predicted ThiF/HesA family dinucleotide-utilizing enzyme